MIRPIVEARMHEISNPSQSSDDPNGIEMALHRIDEEVSIFALRTTWRRIKNPGRPQRVIFSSMIPTGIWVTASRLEY